MKRGAAMRGRKSGVGWVRVIHLGEPVIRCTVCDAIVSPADWWNHTHAAATEAEGKKP